MKPILYHSILESDCSLYEREHRERSQAAMEIVWIRGILNTLYPIAYDVLQRLGPGATELAFEQLLANLQDRYSLLMSYCDAGDVARAAHV